MEAVAMGRAKGKAYQTVLVERCYAMNESKCKLIRVLSFKYRSGRINGNSSDRWTV